MDAADINGDGLPDVAVLEGGKHAGGRMTFAWFASPANPDSGARWTRHNIDLPNAVRNFFGAAKLGDVDGDGDMDLVFSSDRHSGSTRDAYLYWMENPRPGKLATRTDWKSHTIFADEDFHHINDMALADFDRDGKLDVVVRSLEPNRVHVMFQDTANNWTRNTLDVSSWGEDGEGLAVGDLDGDNRVDISAGGRWLRNPNSSRSGNWHNHTIDGSWQTRNKNTKEAIGDLDGDGRLDIVISAAEGYRGGSSHLLAWYRNPGNPTQASSWPRTTLESGFNGGHGLALGDLDGDGDLDIVSGIAWNAWGNSRGIHLYFNRGSSGFFKQSLDTSNGLYNAVVADLGSDGDLDILGQNFYAGTAKPFAYFSRQNSGGRSSAFCGDRSVDAGEECDDGNNNNSDSCNNDCVAATCSDASQNQGEEGIDCGGPCTACDSGGGDDGDVDAASPVLALDCDEGSGSSSADSSGYGRDGILSGGATFSNDTPDGSASACEFNGDSSTLTVPAFDVVGSEITIMAWVRPDSFAQLDDPRILSKATSISSKDHYWMLGFKNGGMLRTRIHAGGSVTEVVGNTKASLGEWTHLAVVYDGSKIRLYVNGVLDKSKSKSGSLRTKNSVAIGVGGQPVGAGSRSLDGAVDSVRVYADALAAGEISAAMNAEPSDGDSATCNDGIRNQGESGVDCGGPCAACAPVPTCNDGIQNQGESDIDCGGPCSACAFCGNSVVDAGEQCDDGNSNNSDSCNNDCVAATCTDAVQNHGEAGIDCGGPCTACDNGGGDDASLMLALDCNEEAGNMSFDGSAYDRDGVLSGGANFSSDSPDRSLSSCVFNGGVSTVTVPAFDVVGSEITIMAWVRPDTFARLDDPRILSKATSIFGKDHYWMLGFKNGGMLRTRIHAGGSVTEVVGNTKAPLGEWTHLAVVYDGSKIRLYVNGVLDKSKSKSGSLRTKSSVAIGVGGQPVGAGPRSLDGAIDGVRVFSRALNAGEIDAVAGL